MKLISKIDKSINFVEEELAGFIESRYVRKCDEYFICYLSSQNACNRGCRMCHLTATGQTKDVNDALPIDYLSQASKVLKHYDQDGVKAKYIHYNFMARGEVLSNQHMINNADSILYDLGKLATSFDSGLGVKFNLSTIMPKDFNKELKDVFKIIHPTFYYSLYSTDHNFRKKWLPNAMSVDDALSKLKDWQTFSKKIVKIHHCFIENENDSAEDVHKMIDKINEFELSCEFNLVRYNPYSEVQGRESSDEVIYRNLNIIKEFMPSAYKNTNTAKMIQRVGPDCYSSCGQFVGRDFSGKGKSL